MVLESKYPENWAMIAAKVKQAAEWCCEGCGEHHDKPPFVLTVHHIDFNPGNCALDNLIALCQRCHLKEKAWKKQPTSRQEIIRRFNEGGKQISMFVE